MGEKPIVSVTYENERISIKNSVPYLKCVTSLLCGPPADLWPFYVNGFLLYRERENRLHKKPIKLITETIGFFPIQINIF